MIFLIGLPGSGKSTVGRQLARRRGERFVDTDHVIEERIECPIRDFFEREGEARFRVIEEQVIDEFSASGGPGVMSTGGGAILSALSRARLNARGQVVYLHALPEDIFRRLRHDKTRPLLQTADPLDRLRGLYDERNGLYREAAHFIIDTGRPSVATLVNMVMMQLELGSTG